MKNKNTLSVLALAKDFGISSITQLETMIMIIEAGDGCTIYNLVGDTTTSKDKEYNERYTCVRKLAGGERRFPSKKKLIELVETDSVYKEIRLTKDGKSFKEILKAIYKK